MANNLQSLVEELITDCNSIFDEKFSDYECEIISNCIRYPYVKAFTSVLSMSEQIQSMISTLSGMVYVRNKIDKLIYETRLKHDVSYDKKFTMFTRMGRPSKQAIESEIYSTDLELRELKNKLDKQELVKNCVDQLVSLLESTIHNYENQKYKS